MLNKKNTKQIMILIAFAALMLFVVINYKLIIDIVITVFKLIIPIIIGIVIAFIINVPMKVIENKIFKIQKRKHKKAIRVISMICSYLLIFGVILFILVLVIPELIQAITILSKNIPNGYEWINDFIEKFFKSYPELQTSFKNFDYKNIINGAFESAGSIFNIAVDMIKTFVSRAITFFAGLILSLYILADKENLIIATKKVLKAFFPDKVTKKIIRIVKLANSSFSKFITGQCTDAFLLGVLCFIGMTILRLPYALIISVLLTTTALIPFVGAFITLAVGAILILVTNPIQSIWYILLFFTLQLFDDNVMNPRVVGKSVGLPPIFALIAVVIGGSIFGFLGMIISIPLASIIYTLFNELVNDRLKNKVDN